MVSWIVFPLQQNGHRFSEPIGDSLDDWANQFEAGMMTAANSPVAIPVAQFSGQTVAETQIQYFA